MKIAYALQNAGAVNLARDIGDAVPVKNGLRGLYQAGHQVSVLALRGQRVLGINDIARLDETWELPGGLPATRAFQRLEGGLRKIQGVLGIPYYARFDSWRFYDSLRRVLPDFDLCHEHNALFSVGAARAAARTRTPYVLTFSADTIMELDQVGKPLKGLHRQAAVRAAAYTYRQAKAILCVSEPARKRLIDQWGVDAQKIHVLPNGVDLALFGGAVDPQGSRRRLGLGSAPVIIFVGGFQRWHGLEILIESFAQVLAVEPSSRLLLVGDGPARKSVEEQVQALGRAQSVTITGLVPQAQVVEWLAAADIAVIPYPRLSQELWFSPLKLYEYMAAGKAIVASRDGQIASVLEDGQTGLLVEPGDVAELAGAILGLIRSPELRATLGRQARQQAETRHSWEGYVRRLEFIYESVIASA